MIRALMFAALVTIGSAVATAQDETRTVELPVGAIVIFPYECPTDGNWAEFIPAQGRFLIGAGIVDDIGEDVRPGDTEDRAKHSHSGRTGQGGNRRGVDNDNDHWPSANEHTHAIQDDTHLPPYVAVVFCQVK